MGVTSWAIRGLGFDLDVLALDYVKILDKLDSGWVQSALDAGDIEYETLNAWLDGTPNSVQDYAEDIGRSLFKDEFYTTASNILFGRSDVLDLVEDGGDKEYLFFPALLPYEIPVDLRNHSKATIIDLIVDMVAPYTNQSREQLIVIVEDINTYGMG